MADLRIVALRKTFGSTVALDGISIDARDGELLTLLGPSGCGKSTTLWSIAGLHKPDSGTITVGGTTFFGGARINLPPEQRNCGVVFQSYAIWPHMTVKENVMYPLKTRRTGNSATRAARVQEVLDLVEMGSFGSRYPHELSGGQQQRVALARALSSPPQLLLLDEPFSNLDAKLRDRARQWLRHLQRSVGVTTVFVTHDQDEALSMSDRIVVMNLGKVHQIGDPEEIYDEPADRFVADFVGTTNLVDGIVTDAGSGPGEFRLLGSDRILTVRGVRRPGRATASIRPEAILVYGGSADQLPDRPNVFMAPVTDRSFIGDRYRYWVRWGTATLIVQTNRPTAAHELAIEVPPDRVRLFPDDASQTPEQAEESRHAVAI